MTSRHVDTIQRIALGLPRYHQHVRRRIAGHELLDMGFAHWEGKPVDPDHTYTVEVAYETNQVRRLIRLYQSKGPAALRAVVQEHATTVTATL